MVPFLFRGIDLRLAAFYCGIIDKDIQASEALNGEIDHRLDLRVAAHVCAQEFGCAPGLDDAPDHGFAQSHLDIRDDDACPFGGEQPGSCRPHT